jgi:hypothetical protein
VFHAQRDLTRRMPERGASLPSVEPGCSGMPGVSAETLPGLREVAARLSGGVQFRHRLIKVHTRPADQTGRPHQLHQALT